MCSNSCIFDSTLFFPFVNGNFISKHTQNDAKQKQRWKWTNNAWSNTGDKIRQDTSSQIISKKSIILTQSLISFLSHFLLMFSIQIAILAVFLHRIHCLHRFLSILCVLYVELFHQLHIKYTIYILLVICLVFLFSVVLYEHFALILLLLVFFSFCFVLSNTDWMVLAWSSYIRFIL